MVRESVLFETDIEEVFEICFSIRSSLINNAYLLEKSIYFPVAGWRVTGE